MKRSDGDTKNRLPAEAMNAPVLDIDGLNITFGKVKAVDHVDLKVERGQLVGLIGSNGAGKTTLLDAVTGFVPSQGSIRFNGSDISEIPAYRRARAGIGRTWQACELFDDIPVRENLQVAAHRRGKTDPTTTRWTIGEITDLLDLERVLDRYPPELSQGQRKAVTLARALAARPELLLADEPAAGLNTEESVELSATLRKLVDGGLTILLVDHDMGLVLGVCDYIYVLDHGQLIATGAPSQIRSNRDVITAYLGEQVDLDDHAGPGGDSVGGQK